MSRKQNLAASLARTLQPTHLEILDESHLHSRGAESHLRAVVVGDAFEGAPRVARHRRVFEAAADVFASGLHALAVEAYTPAEWEKRGGAARADAPACRGGSRHDPAPPNE